MYWCKCYINGQLVASEYDAYNCPDRIFTARVRQCVIAE
jgi:hypothetical protein